MNNQKIYFPNLNGLRFIAALMVIFHHVESRKFTFGLPSLWGKSNTILLLGKMGVVLFFVLSGFLITYLLLFEESTQKNINIKYFYMRRVLRIWPLYFLVIFLAFASIPYFNALAIPGFSKDIIYSNLFYKLILFLFFLPNLVLSLYGIVPYASHTWSIGTEEQYYLIWPVLLKYIKRKRLLFMFIIITLYLIIDKLFDYFPDFKVLKLFWNDFNIDCMAIGGVFAILHFQKNSIIKYLLANLTFYLTLVTVVALIIKGVVFKFLHYEIYAIMFGIIILNFATNDKLKFSLENKILNYLGNISYGLYMLHPIGIGLSIYIANKINYPKNMLIFPLAISLSILIAGISYRYYESYFLKLKRKFTSIPSSES
jgi:peptidoglycan/LPS O-acetylase OafA/YrhL